MAASVLPRTCLYSHKATAARTVDHWRPHKLVIPHYIQLNAREDRVSATPRRASDRHEFIGGGRTFYRSFGGATIPQGLSCRCRGMRGYLARMSMVSQPQKCPPGVCHVSVPSYPMLISLCDPLSLALFPLHTLHRPRARGAMCAT